MKVYVDNGATTKTSEIAIQRMCDLMRSVYGNPSSIHTEGRKANELLNDSRKEVARLLNCKPNEIYFTSGGTEADNQAIISSAMYGAKNNKKHIISSKIEHHAVLHTLKELEKHGFEITLLDVDQYGFISLEDLKNTIHEDTCLVSIMYANNEIGTIQPIREIGKICREKGVIFHTDAVQAIGHTWIDVRRDNIDMLSLSGHKFHAPRGVGVLYCKNSIPLYSMINGGKQENGKRAGTENLPSIAGMAEVMKSLTKNEISYQSHRVEEMRDYLLHRLDTNLKNIKINGSIYDRLPGNLNISFCGIEAESLLLLLDMKGISASSGSACTSGNLNPSHVLKAIGLSDDDSHAALRITIDEDNTMEEMEYVANNIIEIVNKLRKINE